MFWIFGTEKIPLFDFKALRLFKMRDEICQNRDK